MDAGLEHDGWTYLFAAGEEKETLDYLLEEISDWQQRNTPTGQYHDVVPQKIRTIITPFTETAFHNGYIQYNKSNDSRDLKRATDITTRALLRRAYLLGDDNVFARYNPVSVEIRHKEQALAKPIYALLQTTAENKIGLLFGGMHAHDYKRLALRRRRGEQISGEDILSIEAAHIKKRVTEVLPQRAHGLLYLLDEHQQHSYEAA